MAPMKPKRREVSVESLEVRPWFLPAADQLQLHPAVEQHWGERVHMLCKPCCILGLPMPDLHLALRVLELPAYVDAQPGDVALVRALPLGHKPLVVDPPRLSYYDTACLRAGCEGQAHLQLGVLGLRGLPEVCIIVGVGAWVAGGEL